VKRFRQPLAGFDVDDVALLHLLKKLGHGLGERVPDESIQPFDDPPLAAVEESETGGKGSACNSFSRSMIVIALLSCLQHPPSG
jgi:hypothetical protein